MALVNGGFLHYRDMKKSLKNLLRNCWSDFNIIIRESSLDDPFQKFFAKFYPPQNMAMVNGGFLHYIDMKKFLKNFFLQNLLSDFEIISLECSLGDHLQKCLQNFDLSINMALVNGGFLHYTDMEKFLKNLVLRNRRSDFEIISQESSFDISRHPDCPFRAVIPAGKLP